MPQISGGVKFLIVSTLLSWFVLVMVVQKFFLQSPVVYEWLGFVPLKAFSYGCLWQFVTYMFVHSGDVFHIVFNMLLLWMFGSDLEHLWRKKFFLIYYFVCGGGSVLIYSFVMWIYGLLGGDISTLAGVPVVGASGAVFGLLLAYGLIFRERIILFMFIFPMKAKNFTLLVAALEFLSVLNSGFGSPVANLAHLGGLISGFLFLTLRKWQDQGLSFSFPFWKRKSSFIKITPHTDKNILHTVFKGGTI